MATTRDTIETNEIRDWAFARSRDEVRRRVAERRAEPATREQVTEMCDGRMTFGESVLFVALACGAAVSLGVTIWSGLALVLLFSA